MIGLSDRLTSLKETPDNHSGVFLCYNFQITVCYNPDYALSNSLAITMR